MYVCLFVVLFTVLVFVGSSFPGWIYSRRRCITVVGVIEGSVKGGTIASNEQWNCVSVLSEDVYNCN